MTYIEQEAKSLSQSDEFTINGYADRELLNPEVQAYLQSEFVTGDYEQEDDFAKAVAASEFALSFDQDKALASKVALFGFWRKLKEKVRKVFCLAIGGIINEGELDWKEIIKLVLVALLPVFAGGIPAIVLPIIIALIASLMKFGYGKVCPVA
ncbi:hypothetical protein ACR79B_03330 [Sphingobacterium spiritivorum]|uniref:hypothetical protein n=1 Tax=Sphingobacterium spiritivorum TaxID=258 RepID=UPI003DA6C41B